MSAVDRARRPLDWVRRLFDRARRLIDRSRRLFDRSRRPFDHDEEHQARKLFVRVAFGDRYGLALLLAALVFYGLYWRVGVFINDNYTVANALVAVAEGHLRVDRAVYGPGLNTPGMSLVDGRAYGRNYGQVFLALPFLWAIEAVDAVADLRVGLLAAWCLCLLGLALAVGRLLDRERAFAVGGSVLALSLFAGNLAVAAPLDSRWTAWLALQTSSMVFAGMCGVVLYRLLARTYERRVGLFAGGVVAVASPIAFWASLPKRHVLTALFALCSLYCFHRARAENDLRFRALAYVPVGLTAWVHAPEGFVLFVALAAVDLLTAESNDVRSLGIVGATFALSLVPFLATNVLIAGSPLRPPRLLPSYTPGSDGLLTGGEGGGSGGGGSSGGGSSGGGVGGLLLGVARSLVAKVMVFASLVTDGAAAAIQRPDAVVETYLRSGYVAGETVRDGGESINLTVLESLPVLGALAAVPLAAARRVRTGVRRDAVTATDAFVVVYVVLFALVYQTRLPLYAQVTARYLLPVFPFLVYALVRLPAVRRVLREAGSLLAWSYGVTVLLGTQLLLLWLLVTDAALGESVQAHGLLGVALGLLLGGWTLVATYREDGGAAAEAEGGGAAAEDKGGGAAAETGIAADTRVGAVLLGVAAGAGTAFILLSGLYYFAYTGDFALPAVEVVAGLLP